MKKNIKSSKKNKKKKLRVGRIIIVLFIIASIAIVAGNLYYRHASKPVDINSKENIINKICDIILKYIQKKGWSNSNVDFLTYQAEEIVKNIVDERLRNEDTWVK